MVTYIVASKANQPYLAEVRHLYSIFSVKCSASFSRKIVLTFRSKLS